MLSPTGLILQGASLVYIAAGQPKEFMSANTPITQRDVAQACGLHPSTVCLALKNSPSIPLETRQRIQALAAELGYRPNVAARNLALLRSDRHVAARLPIAWINQEARRDHWRADPEARIYFDAASRRAAEAGYHLEEIWTREPGMSSGRVTQILRARGVEGVLFPAHRSFDFSLLNSGWGEFAMVGFNDLRLSEWIDVVCPDYPRNTESALRALRARGFGRIGLVLTSQFDAATSGLVHGVFLRQQAHVSAAERIPVCFAPAAGDPSTAIVEWLHEHQPEAVLCHGRTAPAQECRASSDTAWIQLHGEPDGFDAGIDGCARDVAAAAVDCVVEKMRRFEHGLRESTRLHLLKGIWHERSLARREPQTVVA